VTSFRGRSRAGSPEVITADFDTVRAHLRPTLATQELHIVAPGVRFRVNGLRFIVVTASERTETVTAVQQDALEDPESEIFGAIASACLSQYARHRADPSTRHTTADTAGNPITPSGGEPRLVRQWPDYSTLGCPSRSHMRADIHGTEILTLTYDNGAIVERESLNHATSLLYVTLPLSFMREQHQLPNAPAVSAIYICLGIPMICTHISRNSSAGTRVTLRPLDDSELRAYQVSLKPAVPDNVMSKLPPITERTRVVEIDTSTDS